MFSGSYFHLLDNKGRVSISPRYREILQERQDRILVLTNFDGYILAFPQSEWIKIEAKLAEQAIFNKEVRAFQRFLISGVQECPLDRQGRILIGPYLRDYARLTREVALVGAVRCFEIWDRARYEAHFKQLESSVNEEVVQKLLI
jgi:MraZ protein